MYIRCISAYISIKTYLDCGCSLELARNIGFNGGWGDFCEDAHFLEK